MRLPARLAPALPLLLLPLLCCPHAARGDCGPPPDIPNATALPYNGTTFPERTRIGYYCNMGFIKIHGKLNVVYCLKNGEWTDPGVFCQRSCGATLSFIYAHKKLKYIPVNYHPAGFVVEYECNPGWARNHSLSENITCLEDYTWSKPEVFCYKRSCDDPGKIKNGHIIIPTDILFASNIYFSCDPGYKLVGYNSSYCYYEGDDMIWEGAFPECQERSCDDPGKIKNGHIIIPTDTLFTSYIYFSCDPGYKLVGLNSSYCNYEGGDMIWEGAFPKCQEIPTTPQKPSTVEALKPSNRGVAEIPTATQKPSTMGAPSIKALSAAQKPSTVNVSGTEFPSAPQKPTTVTIPATKAPSAPQKPSTINVPATKAPSAPQKPSTINVPTTKSPSAPQKPTTINVPATKAPSAPQKSTTINVPATKTPSTPQQPTTITIPATKSPSAPQKPTTINVTATKTPSTPQQPTTITIPATKSPSAPQKPATVNIPATEGIPTPQKPTTVNVPATEGTPTLLNFTTRNSSTTKAPLMPQKDTLPGLAMDDPPPSQKPFTASDSATIAKTSVSKALSAETQFTVQTLLTTNSSATRATSKPQNFTTAKASHAQSLPGTQKFSTAHAPMTKGLHTTQRLTSAHIAVTKNQPVFTRQSTPKGSGFPTAGMIITVSGLTIGALIIAIIILTKNFWIIGSSGTYHLHENSKALNVVYHNLTETVIPQKYDLLVK